MSINEIQASLDRAERDRFWIGVVAGYCTMKIRSIDKGVNKANQHLETANSHLEASNQNLHQLNSTASSLLGVVDQQLVVQEQMSEALARLDSNNAAQLKIQKSSLSLQQKQVKLQELQLEAQLAKDTRDEARFKQSELDRKRLIAVKQAIHQCKRQAEFIRQNSEYTNLEKCFSVEKLLTAVASILPDDFEEIADKQYRDETENLLKSHQREYKNEMTQEEAEDLARIQELESVDEDEIAVRLLQKCKIKPPKNAALEEVKKAIGMKDELDQKSTDRLVKQLEKISNSLQKQAKR